MTQEARVERNRRRNNNWDSIMFGMSDGDASYLYALISADLYVLQRRREQHPSSPRDPILDRAIRVKKKLGFAINNKSKKYPPKTAGKDATNGKEN